MHLHIWTPGRRTAGLGTQFVMLSAEAFIRHFRLKRLLCEPWVKNPAPNKTRARGLPLRAALPDRARPHQLRTGRKPVRASAESTGDAGTAVRI